MKEPSNRWHWSLPDPHLVAGPYKRQLPPSVTAPMPIVRFLPSSIVPMLSPFGAEAPPPSHRILIAVQAPVKVRTEPRVSLFLSPTSLRAVVACAGQEQVSGKLPPWPCLQFDVDQCCLRSTSGGPSPWHFPLENKYKTRKSLLQLQRDPCPCP
jgi:hypothetical protein